MMYSTERISKKNVSREADAGFTAELKKTDRARYDRLIHNMEHEASRQVRLSKQVTEITRRKCEYCGLVLASDARADSRYCDDACRKASSRLRLAA